MWRQIFSPFLLVIIVFSLSQCANSDSEKLEGEMNFDDYTIVNVSDDFSIALPTYFEVMNDIDARAVLQYGYIEDGRSDGQLEDEIYISIIEFEKTKNKELVEKGMAMDLSDMNRINTTNLEVILDSFKVNDKSPKTELVNGMSCIKNQFSGKMGIYPIHYQLAVFEVENRFYQILIWCFEIYKSKHVNEINQMIASFERT